jgi:hypothetical protein
LVYLLYSNDLDGFYVQGDVCNISWIPEATVPSTANDWMVEVIGSTTNSVNSSYISDTAWMNYMAATPPSSIERAFTTYVQSLPKSQYKYFTAATAIFKSGGADYEILPYPADPTWKFYSQILEDGGE